MDNEKTPQEIELVEDMGVNENHNLEQTVEEVPSKEELQPQESQKPPKKLNRHEQLVDKLTQSKLAVQNKYEQYQRVSKELDETTTNFMRLENHIVKTTVATSLSLLQELGVDNLEDGIKEAKEIVQDNKANLINIKSISKGSFKALSAGIIGALATATGFSVWGAKLASLPLNLPTFMQKTNLDSIADNLANLINIKDMPIAGYLLVGAVSALVGLVLYNFVKYLQGRKNRRYVNKLEGDVQNYIADLDSKIEKSEHLTEHLDHIKQVMQKYDIILQEQNAKIRRMLFIEQPENGLESLQRASQVEVEKTVLILDELLKLMNATVNDGLEITQESHENLHSANSIINEVIKKLYI